MDIPCQNEIKKLNISSILANVPTKINDSTAQISGIDRTDREGAWEEEDRRTRYDEGSGEKIGHEDKQPTQRRTSRTAEP